MSSHVDCFWQANRKVTLRYGGLLTQPAATSGVAFLAFKLDLERGNLRVGMRTIDLRPKSFEALRYLVENNGRLCSKGELVNAIWHGAAVTDESLTQCVSDVRAALDDRDQSIIVTVPRRGYRFAAPVIAEEAVGPEHAIAGSRPSEAGLASIAVLPFDNLGPDRAADYLADGIVEDIITELSRFSDLTVIARNSSFQYRGRAVDVRTVGLDLGVRYVLEGSIRQVGNRVRITAQLVETETGTHRWAERYDRELHDIFLVQDEISHTTASVLSAHIKKSEMARVSLKPPSQWMAHDFYLQAMAAFRVFQSSKRIDEIEVARRLIAASLAIDPKYARSYALLAWTHCATYGFPASRQYLQPAELTAAIETAGWAAVYQVFLGTLLTRLAGSVLVFHMPSDKQETKRCWQLNFSPSCSVALPSWEWQAAY